MGPGRPYVIYGGCDTVETLVSVGLECVVYATDDTIRWMHLVMQVLYFVRFFVPTELTCASPCLVLSYGPSVPWERCSSRQT